MTEPDSPKPQRSRRVEHAIVGAIMFGVARFLLGLPVVLSVQSIHIDGRIHGVPEASWWILISASIAAAASGGLIFAFIDVSVNQLRGATIGLVIAGVSYIGSAIGGATFMWVKNESEMGDAILGAMLCGTASVITTSFSVVPGMACCGALLGYFIKRDSGGSDEKRQKLE